MGNSFSAVDVISCCESCDASLSTSTPDLQTSANSFLDSTRKSRANVAFNTRVPGEAAWQPDAEVDNDYDDQNSYGPGILWLVNKDKLVVAGFTPGSQAKQASVTRGDVLRKVDDKDVLQMKAQGQKHPAGSLLLGPHASMVQLTLLRVDAHAKRITANPKLNEIVINVARLVPAGDAGYKTDTF
eukprot:CAMPEP_0179415636 /NCGR_PEP_ID=MMETSP0799-20121207/6340_1 /TAXON_ID=46947 /ORGANISM="Geminigera cryophila, Strain CCMP2564" /LENGTH=184 /DNA_ID=CAMNT_0021188393 /DNA_START=171 /DNA_END=725 /DNA_ORIENTATION=-